MAATGGLPRSTPSARGVAADGIGAFLDAVTRQGLELHSFMMLRHGDIIAEGWWKPYAAQLTHMLFSLSKSFTSTAVGLAVHEGRLSVEDHVVSFFPDDLPDVVPPNLEAMRVKHLLMMGTGHDQDTTGRMQQNSDWVKGFLSLNVEHEPGSKFVYNSGATYMLSAIVQKVTGQTVLDFLTPRLFQPLGIEGAAWDSSPQGIHVGGWGLNVKTEDIAKFGQLYLQKGVWNGVQLVPSEWVEQATSWQIKNGDAPNSDWAQGYGYQFWRCRHNIYRGDGAFGQYCVVMPDQDAVIAITSGADDMQAVLNAIWDHILPALNGGDPGQDEALRAQLETLSLASGAAGQPSEGVLALSGKRVALAKNDANIDAVTLVISGDACVVTLEQENRTRVLECGFGKWRTRDVQGFFGDQRIPCAGYAAWDQDGALVLRTCFVTTPFGSHMRLRTGEGVTFEYRSNVGEHRKGVTVQNV